MHNQSPSDLSFCPSFNSYSSDQLADIAAKVCREESQQQPPVSELDGGDDDDFEFVSFSRDFDAPLLSSDEVFSFDSQIRPIFPIFNRDLLLDESFKEDLSSVHIPLKKLFIGDGDPPSESESEADELEGAAPGTYCVWRPKMVEPSPGRCKKSNSTGSSSKRWRLRDLVRRSNSTGGGKESFVFLTPSSSQSSSTKKTESNKVEKPENLRENRSSGEVKFAAGRVKAKGLAVGGGEKVTSAHEAFYVRNRALKEGEKRRSYLPYRRDLVGFFATVNGMGRTFPPF